VDSPELYWNLLSSGRDALVDIPRERWQVEKICGERRATTPLFTSVVGAAAGIATVVCVHRYGSAPTWSPLWI